MTSQDVAAGVQALQMRYIRALDSKAMHSWLGCFSKSPEASYICTSAENEEHILPIALILDDCYARLLDRVTFINEVWKGTYQDYRTRHFVQMLTCDPLADGRFRVLSNVSITYTPEDTGQSQVLAAGIYDDHVCIDNGEMFFHAKKVVLDTVVLPRYLVYPL